MYHVFQDIGGGWVVRVFPDRPAVSLVEAMHEAGVMVRAGQLRKALVGTFQPHRRTGPNPTPVRIVATITRD